MKKSNRKAKKTKRSSGKKHSIQDFFGGTLTLSIVNEDFEKAKLEGREPMMKTVKLFGSNHFPIESNPDNIVAHESNYIHVKKTLLSKSIVTTGFRIAVGDCSDISKDENVKNSLTWRITRSDMFGVSGSYHLSNYLYFMENQTVRHAIDVKPYEITIDGDTIIEVKVWSRIDIVFFVNGRNAILSNFKKTYKNKKKTGRIKKINSV